MAATSSALLIAALLAGCTLDPGKHIVDPADAPCVNTRDAGGTCFSAILLAAHDTASLLPTADEIELYRERWERVVDAFPRAAGMVPFDLFGTAYMPLVYTRSRAIADSLVAGSLVTPDANFTQLMTELPEPQIAFQTGDASALPYYVELRLDGYISGRAFNERLAASDSYLDLAESTQRHPDVTWRWTGRDERTVGSTTDDASITIGFGWGDCLSGCIYYHSYQADVAAEGDVLITDLGGDEMPSNP